MQTTRGPSRSPVASPRPDSPRTPIPRAAPPCAFRFPRAAEAASRRDAHPESSFQRSAEPLRRSWPAFRHPPGSNPAPPRSPRGISDLRASKHMAAAPSQISSPDDSPTPANDYIHPAKASRFPEQVAVPLFSAANMPAPPTRTPQAKPSIDVSLATCLFVLLIGELRRRKLIFTGQFRYQIQRWSERRKIHAHRQNPGSARASLRGVKLVHQRLCRLLSQFLFLLIGIYQSARWRLRIFCRSSNDSRWRYHAIHRRLGNRRRQNRRTRIGITLRVKRSR